MAVEPRKHVLPVVTPLNEPFWSGLREHEVRLQECRACHGWIWPISSICSQCWSPDIRWNALPTGARGNLSSWVVYHRAFTPEFEGMIPYNVIEVNLEEGPRLVSNLVDAKGRNIGSSTGFVHGERLEPFFDRVTEEITLLRFQRPRSSDV